MLTVNGLQKVRKSISNFAQADDSELNTVLLEAVKGIDKLLESRTPQQQTKVLR